jgi:hypothetical protein
MNLVIKIVGYLMILEMNRLLIFYSKKLHARFSFIFGYLIFVTCD